ncbi:MAG: ABC transporter permease [Chloroflexota bacterium]
MSGVSGAWLVAMREIRARLRTRAYQLSTAALVVAAIALVAAVRVLPGLFEDDPLRIAIAPEAAALQPALEQAAEALGREVTLTAFDHAASARAALEAGDQDAALIGPGDLLFRGSEDPVVVALVSQAAYVTGLPARAAEVGLTVEQAQSLLEPPALQSAVVDPDDEVVVDDSQRIVATFTTILLLMAVSLYGQWVLVGVIEEKSNRVVEVLLATLAPWQLLVGKVLGILSLAVLQIAATIAAFVAALVLLEGAELPSVSVGVVAAGVLWLVLGLLLYNFLYAAVGATVTRPDEASSAAFPMMIPLLVGYGVGLAYIPEHPDALLSRAVSLFPLTAPLAMPARLASGGASVLEAAAAVVLTIAATVLVIWAGGRVYTGAILRTRKVGLLDAFRGAREVR